MALSSNYERINYKMSKKLKTRIQYKYDTEENWASCDKPSLKGELYVHECNDGNMKLSVGDGYNYIKDLPFLALNETEEDPETPEQELTMIDLPSRKTTNVSYNELTHTIDEFFAYDSEKIRVSGQTSVINAGLYEITVEPAEGYIWKINTIYDVGDGNTKTINEAKEKITLKYSVIPAEFVYHGNTSVTLDDNNIEIMYLQFALLPSSNMYLNIDYNENKFEVSYEVSTEESIIQIHIRSKGNNTGQNTIVCNIEGDNFNSKMFPIYVEDVYDENVSYTWDVYETITSATNLENKLDDDNTYVFLTKKFIKEYSITYEFSLTYCLTHGTDTSLCESNTTMCSYETVLQPETVTSSTWTPSDYYNEYKVTEYKPIYDDNDYEYLIFPINDAINLVENSKTAGPHSYVYTYTYESNNYVADVVSTGNAKKSVTSINYTDYPEDGYKYDSEMHVFYWYTLREE